MSGAPSTEVKFLSEQEKQDVDVPVEGFALGAKVKVVGSVDGSEGGPYKIKTKEEAQCYTIEEVSGDKTLEKVYQHDELQPVEDPEEHPAGQPAE